ncbi:MAG: hypothetical protein P0Y56_14540 [Candidatus Andeanibacterium colombiense]|uniref:Outer membrane assembly lipoprotein YfiO n=1 Tax=Candidatus Andeanibacterium colombiense TaxID=3121345 RepID=A0AAJ5X7V7_9SPHN|nr:MAG: hypothetical protein P0Y56_14540 [Sphingomonadaceae bacterium]
MAGVVKRLAIAALMVAASWAFGGPAAASGDFSCSPSWTLTARDLDCGSSLVISPGADSRVNLALLLRDRAGLASKPGTYPTPEWDYSFGHNFVDWSIFSSAAYPRAEQADNAYFGSRCVSLKGGDAAFRAAVAANRKLLPDERDKLVAARDQLAPICAGSAPGYYVTEPEKDPAPRVAPAWPVDVRSKAGQEFVAYLVSAAAFYGEDWDGARKGFAGIATSADPWLKETAKYMAARVDLNAAQAMSFDEWGSFDQGKTDHAAAARAGQALAAYLSAYPKGSYAASARGLQRRVYWLQGDLASLADAYEAMLDASVPGSTAESELIEEVDNKLLSATGIEPAIDTPLLLATYDLMRMRPHDAEYAEHQPGVLDEAELAAQEPAFKGRAELFQFLHANYSFYVKSDARDVLLRIADNSVSTTHSALDFSRQILRGQALAQLKDPGEEAFWRRLIGGSTGLYQRPAAELGLALLWERSGRLPLVFAPDSPVQDSMIRKLLIEKVAGPDILRAEARSAARPKAERDLALLTLLYKQLRRGQYAAFVGDVKLVPAGANTDAGLWNLTGGESVPVGLFTAGKFTDTYACPALGATAAALAANPKDVKGRLCLGEFYRLNGFDDFIEFEQFDPNDYSKPAPQGTLGSGKTLFPGSETPRAAFYASIMADPAAPAPEKAYAYYRAIRCYAPSGNNTCGGADVDESQRKAWFAALKRQYPNTRWAKELQYYW